VLHNASLLLTKTPCVLRSVGILIALYDVPLDERTSRSHYVHLRPLLPMHGLYRYTTAFIGATARMHMSLKIHCHLLGLNSYIPHIFLSGYSIITVIIYGALNYSEIVFKFSLKFVHQLHFMHGICLTQH
jgi:hypothetical protein